MSECFRPFSQDNVQYLTLFNINVFLTGSDGMIGIMGITNPFIFINKFIIKSQCAFYVAHWVVH